ncbi:DsbA family oxidoreductase [Haloarculaceae archaeon H-GB2-1]|nr:DsbA family oxidoreductase [Haloarculaceae archaeon H-GB1-1]MEA5386901.1 DsbA family oxidoreductase [Haloarculaceae archaeon H-GB11]MEA5408382.1 DsbA family oxidoreductase [Haloarculaceae archaeon H-GB2-1]
MDTSEREEITVYSDYVCPFCYLGRQSLAQYQERRESELVVDWRPFDLRSHKRGPDGEIDRTVDDGKDEDYYEQAREGVRRLQEKYDVEMTLDIAEDVDSLDAQVASFSVREQYDYETWLAFDVAIFEALWTEGRDVGEEAVLVELAEDVGIDGEDVRAALDDETVRTAVTEQFERAQRAGITGVPTFAYDGHAARGAVPPEQLERLVEGV